MRLGIHGREDEEGFLIFADRAEAGRRLAERLLQFREARPVVLALPRGGVPVAYEIARTLGAPLDLVLVRKIGAPWQPELALGAVSDGDVPRVALNQELITAMGIDQEFLDAEVAAQFTEVKRQVAIYRRGRPPVPVNGRTVIVVDDGIATGATVRAGIAAIRQDNPARIILAVPVAAIDSLELLRPDVDDIICLQSPPNFSAVGRFYVNFDQTTNEQVIAALDAAASNITT